MTTLRLREWKQESRLLLEPTQVELLLDVFGAHVTPVPGAADQYDVRSGSIVGVAQRGHHQVVVVPKLPVPRVLFLVAYASEPSSWRDTTRLEAAPDLPDAIAVLFLDRLQRSLQRGLLHDYREVESALMTVRGRVDVAEQLRRRPGVDAPVQVRYQEFDEDVLENRLLLAALRRLARVPLRHVQVRRGLHRALSAFELVSDWHFPAHQVPQVPWTRRNEHYRPSIELARLLLAERSVELSDGQADGSQLTLDMNLVFETFVRVALREALGLTPDAFPVGAGVKDLFLDKARRVRLEPDLSWWSGSHCLFVGDVKYKRDNGPGHNGDLYQLLAYVTAANLRQGRLVYADGSPPGRHEVVHAQVELIADRLDVSLPPDELLAAVRRLALDVRQSVDAPAQ